MDNVIKELQANIRKHLPEQVGIELQKVLKKAKEDSDEVVSLKERVTELEKVKVDKSAEITKLVQDRDDTAKRVGDLEKREKEVTDREVKVDLVVERTLRIAADKTNESVERLCERLFSGGRTVLTHRHERQVPDPQATYQGQMPLTLVDEKTIESKED